MRWVMDPIDGTVNYLYGFRWAVSIAAEIAGEAVAGAVESRFGGDFTACWAGGLAGAGWGAPISAALQRGPGFRSRCTRGHRFRRGQARRAVQGEVVADLLPLVRDIRRGGSAADLCSVRRATWTPITSGA